MVDVLRTESNHHQPPRSNLKNSIDGSNAFAPSSGNHALIAPRQSTNDNDNDTPLFMAAKESSSNAGSPLDFLSGFFKQDKGSVQPKKPKIPDVVIDSDFTLSYVFGALGIFIILTSPDKSCVRHGSWRLYSCPGRFPIIGGLG